MLSKLENYKFHWSTILGEFISYCASLETLMDEVAWQAAYVLGGDVKEISREPPKSFEDKLKFAIKLAKEKLDKKPRLELFNFVSFQELRVLASDISKTRNAVAHAQVTDASTDTLVLDRYREKRNSGSSSKTTASYDRTVIPIARLKILIESMTNLMVLMELIIQSLSWMSESRNQKEIGRSANLFVSSRRDLFSLQMLNSGHVKSRDGTWHFEKS